MLVDFASFYAKLDAIPPLRTVFRVSLIMNPSPHLHLGPTNTLLHQMSMRTSSLHPVPSAPLTDNQHLRDHL